MTQIRGLFVSNGNYANIPFETYVNAGCTDIFCNGAVLGRSSSEYTKLISQLINVINACEGLDLNIWCDSAPFLASSGWTTPLDTDHQYLMISQIEQLFADLPELKGITFDDYNYPPSKWAYPHRESNTQPQTITAMANYATAIKDIVHSLNKKIGAFVPAWDILGFSTPNLAPVFDFISPEIYKNMSLPYNGSPNWVNENTDSWIKNMILSHKSQMETDNLIPCLMTYDLDGTTPRTLEDVITQIKVTLDCNMVGYVLFNQLKMVSGVPFLSAFNRTYSDRSYSNRHFTSL